MKKFFNKIRNRIQQTLLPFQIALYDGFRMYRYSVQKDRADREKMQALITCHYHVIEKGLSMKEVRPLFGKDVVPRLIELLDGYERAGHDPNDRVYQTAIQVLAAYSEYHEELAGIEPLTEPLASIKNFFKEAGVRKISDVSGGTKCLTRAEVLAGARGSFPELMTSRYSVRDFGTLPVAVEDISKAVQWAQKSPSVCNRQEVRVFAVKDAEKIKKILLIQGGARGFAEQIDTLLIVGGDLRAFHSPVERNQVYCDSGIFAMSLLLGLHHLGLGACPLHWCVDPAKDRQLRELADISPACSVAMLIAVGTLTEQFNVAFSQRIEMEKVLFWR